MRFPSAFLDDVRDRISLSTVVARRVTWDKRKTNAAKRDYWACCPFHGEKSPSFHVDDRKGMYHCFGCGVTGDHFRFLMELEGKEFPEAVTELAEQAGLALPEVTPESRAAAARRLTMIEANERAAIWYQRHLQGSPQIMAYVEQRGITAAEVVKYRLGYAPDGNALQRAVLGDQRDMIEAGLLGQDGDRVYDRFRNRLMFPILNSKGEAIAFSGRALATGQEPKYLNSPETAIFDKGSVLYNGAAAREAAWNGAQLVVVEGQIDVIAACRAGAAAVAPLGTALTEQHIKAMMKATDDPVLCFDGDAAGHKAAMRAVDLILPFASPQFSARFATLPDGQDPDSMVKRSPEAFLQAVSAAAPLVDVLWRRETVGIAAAVPEQRAKLEGNLRKALATIADRDTRRAYGLSVKDRLASLGQRPTLYRSNSYSQHSTSPSANRLLTSFQQSAGLSLREAILVGAIASAPQAALDLAENLSADTRLSQDALQLIGKLVMAMSDAPDRAMTEILEATGLTDVVNEALAKAGAAGVSMEIGSEGAAALGILQSARKH